MFMEKLKIGALVCSFAVGLTATAYAQEVKWISGGINPPNSTSALAAQYFADLVNERSDGRIQITHYPASQLGSGQEQIEGLAAGTQQLFLTSGSQASRLVPEYSIIDVAFLFQDTKHLERVLESDIGQELNQKLVDQFGIRVLAYNWYGLPRYLMHKSKFIEETADVKNVRTRAPSVPIYIANYENIGAVPVQIAYGEQYLALSQGLVDMTESSAHNIYGMKLHEVAPFITEADMMFPQNSVFISEAALTSLSPEDREMIEQAAVDAGDDYTRKMQEAYVDEREKIIAEGGQFEKMPEETRAAFVDMISEAVPSMVADGLVPEGWIERINEMRDE